MIELLEHNKETYKRLCEVLEANNKCALVQATGTGKSYIAGKYIEEHTKTALILVPTNAIADAWSDLLNGIEQEVDIITYQAFAKEPNNYLEYDLVIADEMHHLGSEVWGKKFVETYLQSENHKIVGLTATEIRYLDNSRDMAEEIFDNIRVDGCDLPTAINTGVLPTFKYVSALYCDESDFDEWREKAGKIKDIKTQNELKGKLDVCIKNMVSVKQAVNENLTDDYKKIIVFLNNVESKETALEMFKDVFPTANFYDVDYSKSRAENNSQIEKFKADVNRAVFFAVDMLNEGIHVKGTDCIIMFRKTVSPQVYLQQLGRGLASGTDKTPIIFDFVGNTNSITSKSNFYGNSVNDFIENANRRIKRKERKIIIKSYIKEISDCLKEIQLWTVTDRKAYSEDELNFIKNNYEKLGSKRISEILGRSQGGIQHFARKMNISEPKENFSLNEKEMEEVLEKLKEVGITKTAKHFGINLATLRKYLSSKGITWDSLVDLFSDEEVENVIKLYKSGKSVAEISRDMKRNPQSIRKHLLKRGFEIKNSTYRPVVALNEDGTFYKRFSQCAIAADEVGTSRSSITFALKGRYKTAGGYKWLYEEDYQKMIAKKE